MQCRLGLTPKGWIRHEFQIHAQTIPEQSSGVFYGAKIYSASIRIDKHALIKVSKKIHDWQFMHLTLFQVGPLTYLAEGEAIFIHPAFLKNS